MGVPATSTIVGLSISISNVLLDVFLAFANWSARLFDQLLPWALTLIHSICRFFLWMEFCIDLNSVLYALQTCCLAVLASF
jgi:hypothetical protein